jgi:hypothetical protein
MSDLKRYSITNEIQAYRTGWRGVWDAVKAALTRHPRLTVSTPVTFSCFADKEVRLQIVQVEEVAP